MSHMSGIKSPITGMEYELCDNCNHVKQAHFCGGREHECSNSDNFPKLCNCKGWK